MDELRIVIIGGVAIGPKAAARAKRCHPNAKITIIEKSQWLSYGGCGLPYFLGATVKEMKDLMATSWGAVRNQEFFNQAKDIDVMLGWEAIKIERGEQKVIISNLQSKEIKEVYYDKLVLATGSEPIIPDIIGISGPGVFKLYDPQDAMDIKRYLMEKEVQQTIIIGAGLIGLESTEALANWGLEVTVIEKEGQILPQLLDQEMALLVQSYLQEEGLKLVLDTKVTQIIRNQQGFIKGVETTNGFIPGQMILFSTGVRPNTKLAQDAGLEVNKGIVVNQYLQTTDTNIYAGGDCVLNIHRGGNFPTYIPLGSTANKHGRIIGTNITGGQETFPGVMGTSILKIFDWNVGRTGYSETLAKELGYEVVTAIVASPDKSHFYPGKKIILTKLIADKATGKILGSQIIGPGEISKRLDTLVACISFGAKVEDVANLDLAYAPPFSPAMDNIINAANVLKNIMAGVANTITFADFHSKLQQDNVVFVDLRIESEQKLKDIPAKNVLTIPYEELRQRMGEIPKDKEIIPFCRLSVRAYEAQVYLNQAGFTDVKFLDGGIEFWPFEQLETFSALQSS